MKSSWISLFVFILALSACSLERNAQYGYHFSQRIRSKNNFDTDVPQQSSPNLISLLNATEPMTQTDVHHENAQYQHENIREQIPLEEIGSYGMRQVKKNGDPSFYTLVELTQDSTFIAENQALKGVNSSNEPRKKNYLLASLMCLTVGWFGIHWMYLDDDKKGVKRLLTTLLGGLILILYGWPFNVIDGVFDSYFDIYLLLFGILLLFLNAVLIILDFFGLLRDVIIRSRTKTNKTL